MFATAVSATGHAAPVPEIQRPPSVAQARQFMQQAGDRMVAVLNQPGDWRSKELALAKLIGDSMDVNGIARFALGRFWNTATDAQRDAFVRLFPIVLLGELGRSMGVLQGMTFTIDRGVARPAWVEIWTTVYRPGFPTRQVEWLVGLNDGEPRIVDVLAEGSSLRITQREDIVSFLSQHHHSMVLLLDALQRKIAEG